jgi:hypothetical protein
VIVADLSLDISHKRPACQRKTGRLTGRRQSTLEDGLYRVYVELHVYGRHFRANSRPRFNPERRPSGCRVFAQAASHLDLVQGRILIEVACRRRFTVNLVLQIVQDGTASSPPRIIHRQSRSILLSRGRVHSRAEGSKNWIRDIKDSEQPCDAG